MAQPRFDSVARSTRRLHGGFTLIELMVTVAVIAILAAIAVPIYTSYIERANVQEGLQKLSVSRTRMEQYFMDHRTYAKDGNACGFDPTTLTPSPAKEKFALKCDIKDAGGTTYEVVATGQGSMAGFTYTINQLAVGTSTLTKSGWSTGGTVNCWVTRPGETC